MHKCLIRQIVAVNSSLSNTFSLDFKATLHRVVFVLGQTKAIFWFYPLSFWFPSLCFCVNNMFYFKGLSGAIAELCPECMFTFIGTMGSFYFRESIKNA